MGTTRVPLESGRARLESHSSPGGHDSSPTRVRAGTTRVPLESGRARLESHSSPGGHDSSPTGAPATARPVILVKWTVGNEIGLRKSLPRTIQMSRLQKPGWFYPIVCMGHATYHPGVLVLLCVYAELQMGRKKAHEKISNKFTEFITIPGKDASMPAALTCVPHACCNMVRSTVVVHENVGEGLRALGLSCT